MKIWLQHSLATLVASGVFSMTIVPAQNFINGDPGSVLFTNHTGGYLGHGVSFADFNGDGNDDLTFTQWEGNIITYAGNGQGQFVLRDEGIGNLNGEPKSALWVDFDNDGDRDLLITQRLARNKLYARMADGTLQAVPNAGGLEGTELERTYGASIADYDKDGRLDVYLCHFHLPGANSETNRLFRSVGGVDLEMAFEDVTVLSGTGNGVKQSFQSTWVDVDRDGWLDLHVINDRLHWADALYKNMGDGTFEDVSSLWGVNIQEYSMSSSLADFDKDGDWDFIVSNGAGRGNVLLRCQGQPFLYNNIAPELQYVNVASDADILLEDLAWGALWFDANNDGWQDLFIGTGTSNYTDYPAIVDMEGNNPNGFWLNNQGQLPLQNESTNVITTSELAFSSAWADHNKDGALDVVSHRVGLNARLLNGVPNGNHWIQFELNASSGNSEAIGALVTVWNDGKPDMRTVTCGSEYLNQNSMRLHFGLGASATFDSVTVDWPSGGTTTHLDLDVDVVHTLNENDEELCVNTNVSGCTYEVACNFDENAIDDDGSCDWSCLCGDGTIWDPVAGHCVVLCAADLNLDGEIGALDLVTFLTVFGQSCF